MNVLSLFDGMSCAQIALERAGIVVNKYFASETDKYAIKMAMTNYPDTIQMGCVKDIDIWDLPQIDLLIGGSPCQGFSFAGKQLNFDDPRSKLFFEFVRILERIKSSYFLLENVRMKKEYQDIISGYLGVKPIGIDSNLLSAQNRKRLYWTNIPGVEQPKDKGIMLKDIVHEYEPDFNPERLTGDLAKYIVSPEKTLNMLNKEMEKGKIDCIDIGVQEGQAYRVHGTEVRIFGEAKANYFQYDINGTGHGSQDQRAYYSDGKHGTIGTNANSTAKYIFGCMTPDRAEKRQNGQRFNVGQKFYTLTTQDRYGVLIDGYIRKLTPIECERLQTVSDGLTDAVSDSQRYKMLGNGMTVDVIAHILTYIPMVKDEDYYDY